MCADRIGDVLKCSGHLKELTWVLAEKLYWDIQVLYNIQMIKLLIRKCLSFFAPTRIPYVFARNTGGRAVTRFRFYFVLTPLYAMCPGRDIRAVTLAAHVFNLKCEITLDVPLWRVRKCTRLVYGG